MFIFCAPRTSSLRKELIVPRISMTLFTGSILVMALCRNMTHLRSFAPSIPPANLLFGFTLLLGATLLLNLILERHPQQKTATEYADPRGKRRKKRTQRHIG